MFSGPSATKSTPCKAGLRRATRRIIEDLQSSLSGAARALPPRLPDLPSPSCSHSVTASGLPGSSAAHPPVQGHKPPNPCQVWPRLLVQTARLSRGPSGSETSLHGLSPFVLQGVIPQASHQRSRHLLHLGLTSEFSHGLQPAVTTQVPMLFALRGVLPTAAFVPKPRCTHPLGGFVP